MIFLNYHSFHQRYVTIHNFKMFIVCFQELEKLKNRKARFGSSESSLLKSAEHIEKLKQRQARFGTFESKTLQNIEEEEKKVKRAAKFGIPTSNEEEQKKQLREARFNTKQLLLFCSNSCQ